MRSTVRVRGITFLELIVAFAVTAIIVPGIVAAFIKGLTFQAHINAAAEAPKEIIGLEDKIKQLISGAMLTASTTDTNSYFVVDSSSGSQTGLGDTLVFTGFGERTPGSVLSVDVNEDFETLNNDAGPWGGLEEVSISMTPAGQVGSLTGLFLREQRPPDSDITQGGFESLLDGNVQSISFECFDGTNWDSTWDTRTSTSARRLPAAVRVTYVLTQDPNTQHVFIVRLPMSDVTPTNPVTTSSGGTSSQ
jgi:type II secretory pathway component PulJ